ncbi:MAG: phospholipid carrier-dependent glycosyltransferase, partial [Anaerolineales bacterium]|nr:phospholipid carrier-dependent glycosyltransferase [Anaerolineales bacterium]
MSRESTCREMVALALIVAGHLALALLYGVVTPVHEGPDETGHIMVVAYLARERRLPVQSPENAWAYGYAQEGSQAPLYYALNAALLRGLGLSLEDLDGPLPTNPFTTCGAPGLNNVARYQHDPHQEAFPFQGSARAIHVMRALSALLGTATVALVYAVARLAFPQPGAAALLAALLVASNPQAAYMGGVVNNDGLVNLLTALALVLTLYGVRRGFTWWGAVALGLVCGLATLAKLGGLMALAFAGFGLIVALWRRPARLIGMGVLVVAGCLAVSGWWFVRNWRLYGDPTGMSMMLSVVGGRSGWPVDVVLSDLLHTYRSYWGVFACEVDFPLPVYGLFAGLSILALVGWLRGERDIPRGERWPVALLALWLALVMASWVRWNQLTYAPLGRLFFQANGAIAPLLGYGLACLTRRPRWIAAGVGVLLSALSVVGALLVIRPAFTLPVIHPATAVPAPAQSLPTTAFGDEIEVLGYDVQPRSVEPGEILEVTLFFQALRPIPADYTLALQLLSPVSGETTTLVNFNTVPGNGNLPTSTWAPGEVIEDRYRLRIPWRVERAQAWRVGAIMFRQPDGQQRPVSIDGQPAGNVLGLGLVRVGAPQEPQVPAEARLESPTTFGGALELYGVHMVAGDGILHVRAWWRAKGTLDADYTALVHLYGAGGDLLAAADTPPLNGGFPTSL